MRNFQLEKMMGFWNVIQYYSSTEETAEYKCMRGDLEITDAKEVSSSMSPLDLSTHHVPFHSVSGKFHIWTFIRITTAKLDLSQMSNLEQLKFAKMGKKPCNEFKPWLR